MMQTIMEIIKESINNMWPMLTIFLVVLASVRVAAIRSNNERLVFYKEFSNLLFIIYILLLYELLTRSELNHVSGYNLVPFTEIFRYPIGSQNFYFNVIGNIVMFMPLGYFLPRIAKYKKGIVYTTFECFEFSFLVEIFQLYTKKGCCDVDDIILNTLGGFLGYIVYYICLREKIKKCQEREDVIDLNLQKKNNLKKG